MTADGELVHATADEHPDLFWALRGGGGNFGVVTRFDLTLHDVGTQALVAEVDLDPARGLEALRAWLAWSDDAPRRATLFAEVRAGAPLTLGFVWVGPPDDAASTVARLDGLGDVLARRVAPISYLDLQQQSDVGSAYGFRRYAKSHYVRELPDAALEAFLAHTEADLGAASLVAYGGAIADVDPAATAFAHRDTRFEYDVGAKWEDPADDERHAATCRRLAATIEPWSVGVYVNALGVEGVAGVHRAYGDATFARLQEVKSAWDPTTSSGSTRTSRRPEPDRTATRPRGSDHAEHDGLAEDRRRDDGLVRRAVAERGSGARRPRRGAVGRDPWSTCARTGVRVRLASDEHAEAVSAAARDLGLAADPAALQQLSVVLESADAPGVTAFWQSALDYAAASDGGLADPLRRDPALDIRRSTEDRPLRNRFHVDVVRPAAAVEQAGLGEASGPFGVRHVDPDGNEVDLVPGDALGESAGTADWQAVFSAMACYRTTSPTQQRDLAAAAAALADDAGFPLLVDLRPGLVILDSGKDLWEAEAHGLELDFADLAEHLQAAARDLGATADLSLPRFVQLVLDAADIDAVRAFWVAALGYTPDPRAWVIDIDDPRRLNPVLMLQEIDASETERRRQRNRTHLELAVPSDLAQTRLATTVAAGGRLLDESDGRWRVADPEGNELVIVSGT